MTRLLVSARGSFDHPTLIEIDLDTEQIGWTPLDLPTPDTVPTDKRGTMGLVADSSGYAVATWDAVVELDHRLRTRRVHRSPYFSDLHGLHADPDGGLLVVSTNAGAVLRIGADGAIGMVWAERPKDLARVIDEHGGLALLTKHDVGGVYRNHVNDVAAAGGSLLVSHLGVPSGRWRRRLARRTRRPVPARRGGIRVIDGERARQVRDGEGLHDLVVDGASLLSTEYFGHAVVRTSTEGSPSTTRIPLEGSPLPRDEYLTRGICPVDSGWWIGRTVRRGQRAGAAVIEHYERTGRYSGRAIELDGIKGPYSIIVAGEPT